MRPGHPAERAGREGPDRTGANRTGANRTGANRRRLLLLAGGSALVHLLVVAALVVPWPSWIGPAPAPRADVPASVEVVMVRQPARTAGQPATATPAATAQDASPDAPNSSAPNSSAPNSSALGSPALPPGPDLALSQPAPNPAPAATPPPPPAPPPAPAPPSPPRAASEPAVNLGGDPSDPLVVTSDTVRPPEPDARYRNLPPRYPAEAAVLGEHGTVSLLIHVAADGTAEGVDVVESSGFPVLDREARRAVQLWHFAPARRDGLPVPYDYPFSIHFRGD